MNYAKVPKDILPTLVIGLGGTGYQIIKRLKQLFNKRYGGSRLPVRYLLIDTDLKSFLDDSFDNNEKCQLRFGDGIKNTLDWAYNNPNFDWLPRNPKITPDFFTSTDQGAGLMRPIGRLYLCRNAKLVYDILSSAKNDLVDLHKVLTDLGDTYLENIDRHKVYIVGSLAGGTGCGTFLDVSVMLSNIFNRDNTNIIGMFTLESCYDDKLSSDIDSQSRSKANCYAALKELEFYMSSINNPGDRKYVFKYSNIGELRLEKKLLDVCYLIENRNEMGGVLSNIEDIYDLCALQLFQEVGTKLGSQLRADYANFICKDKDPVLKKDRHFSTFSCSSMEFPVENLRNYCIYRLAKEMLEQIGQERSLEDQLIEDEISKLLEQVDNTLDMSSNLRDYAGNLKITNQVLYKELNESKKGNLDKAARYSDERRQQWAENKLIAKKTVEEVFTNYLNNNITGIGVRYVGRILMKLESRVYNDFNDSAVTSNIDKEKIKSNITSITDRRVKAGKDPIDSSIIAQFNGYLEQEQKRLRHEIYRDRYNLIKDIVRGINDRINLLLAGLGEMRNEINNQLNRLGGQNSRRYGGNIISREMTSREFYEAYYLDKFGNNLDNKIVGMLEAEKLPGIIKQGAKALIAICTEEFERTAQNITIMDILSENAKSNNLNLNEYVKNELDTAARLAKPFWSAVKNPEVSWTECYYVGSIRDEDMNNSFTIKPPEAIDRWIRSQTGERSRQARYVETTNPYSIDVIHIIMGACAAYLPDIKNYKQFYLKFVASRTYPLHLDERYIGLEEIDIDTDRILQCYSLSRAYGVILQIAGNFYINMRRINDGFSYIYSSDNCLRHKEYYEGTIDEIPGKTSLIPEDLKLGSTYAEAIYRINGDDAISTMLREFIEDTERVFSREELREHCMAYIRSRVSEDFIATEKITHRLAAN